jgi:transcriptional regulator with XRE-family HTH domain
MPQSPSFLDVPQFDAHAIGARIAEARHAKNLTQEQLAGACSFSVRSLAGYEAGNSIPFKFLHELSEVLERRVAWFLYGDLEDVSREEQLQALAEQLSDAQATLRRIETLLNRDGPEQPPPPPEETR